MVERILPTLSLENRLGTFCQDQGMSLDFFAAIADQRVSASRLRVAIRGEKDLEQPAATVIDTLLGELRVLAKEHEPFKLQWVNPQLFRGELEKRRLQK